MNPYCLHIFDKDDHPLPIVRMVFALASPTADVVVVNNQASRRDLLVRPNVKPTEHDVYSRLLKLSRMFLQAYEAAQYENTTFETLRRGMHPGTALHPDHWSFITGLGGSVDEELAYYYECEEDEVDNDDDVVWCFSLIELYPHLLLGEPTLPLRGILVETTFCSECPALSVFKYI
jgi:hypothetical protein